MIDSFYEVISYKLFAVMSLLLLTISLAYYSKHKFYIKHARPKKPVTIKLKLNRKLN